MPGEGPSPEALVRTLGTQALPLFFALLLALLLVATVLWWLARRYAVPRETDYLPPSAYLLIRLALGFAVVVGAAAVFAEAAEVLGDGHWAGKLDQIFSEAVRQSISAQTFRIFAWATHLGDTLTLTLLCIVVALLLAVQRRRWLALAWTLAFIGNAVLNSTLKAIFARARPLHDETLIHVQGFSFPSGHSSGAVVAYGMLAYVLLHSLSPAQASRAGLPVVLATTALAFTIGCSRIFIQVHFATDVLAGFASGTAWLAVCIGSIAATRHYRQPRG